MMKTNRVLQEFVQKYVKNHPNMPKSKIVVDLSRLAVPNGRFIDESSLFYNIKKWLKDSPWSPC